MTFTIYDASGTVVLAQKTSTIDVPYRLAASPLCTGGSAGKWYNSKDKACYNGLPSILTVSMSDLAVTVPGQVIWSVRYNTTSSGYPPIWQRCLRDGARWLRLRLP